MSETRDCPYCQYSVTIDHHLRCPNHPTNRDEWLKILQKREADLERENARLRAELEGCHLTMMAAAEEIGAHWDAHCDADGYGPVNLERRLKECFAARYEGYSIGEWERLKQRVEQAEADSARLQDEIALLNGTLDSRNREIENLLEVNKVLSEENARLRRDLSDAEKELDEYEGDISRMQDELALLNGTLDSRNREIADMVEVNKQAELENREQARLLGMSAERELSLRAKLERAREIG